jgi:hypothetical protein
MIPVIIPDLAYQASNEFFIKWIDTNIGEFGKDWKWVDERDPFSISVRVKDPEKATLVALRWSGK